MTRHENDDQPQILFSQKTKKQFTRVIGFDLGSADLCCSLSNDDRNPASPSVFRHWVSGSKTETLYPACIQYKNWAPWNTNDIKVGFAGLPEKTPLDDGDVYIPSIKTYVVQQIMQGAKEDGPDASLVLAHFFKTVCAIFDREFKKFYSLVADCRFCFGVPDGLVGKLEYTQLIREAFKQAGFLNEHDDDNRLIFVDDAVAAGYNCLATPCISSGFEPENNYLVADIGYHSAKFSIIKAQTTEAARFVVSSVSKGAAAGYRSLSDNLGNYLTERSETLGLDITNNPQQINKMVDSFERYQKIKMMNLENDNDMTEFKGPVLISTADLEDWIFKPFLDYIFRLVHIECQTNAIRQIIFRGQYCNDASFYQRCVQLEETLSFQIVPTCVAQFMVCQGVVSFGLGSVSTQIPTLLTRQNLEIKVKDVEAFAKNQQSTKDNAIPKGHFVVGIDFGSTFSGCSYADINTIDLPTNKREIITMKDWDKAQPYPKIATALRYNSYKNKFSSQWGYEALQEKKNELQLEFFKLLLSPVNVERTYGKGHREIQNITDILFAINASPQQNERKKRDHNSETLTPVKILAKYLFHLNLKIKEMLQKKSKVDFEDLKIYYVLTVPVMWTETDKSTMIEAAIEAKLINRGEEKAIQLITEPEAAALACQVFINNTFKLTDDLYRKELNFIVFDAGGGTVDLTTFRKQRDSIQQIGDGTGDICGAVQLDRNFRQLLETFYYHVMGMRDNVEELCKHHMDYFAKEIKENFMPSGNCRSEYKIHLPSGIAIPGYAEWTEYPGFDSSCELTDDKKTFIISEIDIKRFVFDPVIDRVLELLGRHIEKSAHLPLSAVLLVGGFSQSRYLQKRVKDYCTERGISHVGIPPEGVTAVSRGAVSYFLDPRLVSKKTAAASYAIQVDYPDRDNDKSHVIRKDTPSKVEEILYRQTISADNSESAVNALFSGDDEKEMTDHKVRVEPFDTNNQNDMKKMPNTLFIHLKTYLSKWVHRSSWRYP